MPVLSPLWPCWVFGVAALLLLGLTLAYLARLAPSMGLRGIDVSLLLVVRDREEVMEGTLRQIIRRYGWWLAGGPTYEVVVVDDGSADDTPAILERMARGSAGFIRFVRAASALGESPLGQGLAACRGRSIVVINVERGCFTIHSEAKGLSSPMEN